jgi:hypothetical protein
MSLATRSAIEREPAPQVAAGACSAEERAMRDAVMAWGRRRWPDARILHELVIGERRIDLLFVSTGDLFAVELKSARDRLDRLDGQLREYAFYLPEVWIAIAPRWEKHKAFRHGGHNVIVVDPPKVAERRRGEKPHRDELVCSRLLELLWGSEALAIAQRTDVLPRVVHEPLPAAHVKKLLARLLTGNEIIREVCTELRARALVGLRSDPPTRTRR